MLVGTFLAFDRHMNMVLADCEEYRRVQVKASSGSSSASGSSPGGAAAASAVVMEDKEIKRSLGFLLLRGENIVSFTAEAPPAPTPKKAGEGPVAGPGLGVPAGRGMPVAPLAGAPPMGLVAPVRGIGGPAASLMMPTGARPPGAPQMLMGQPMGMPPAAMMRMTVPQMPAPARPAPSQGQPQ
eukprot:GHVT01076140.1.p1 GENE.GHVT01076140.1~~GHVT01076140.1.p1  ORF type:complete len:183 (-),score=45.77 GHVT01076140.1:741-1289(-)